MYIYIYHIYKFYAFILCILFKKYNSTTRLIREKRYLHTLIPSVPLPVTNTFNFFSCYFYLPPGV